MISHRLLLVTIGLLAGGPTRAADSNTASPPSPAQVTNPIKETDLTTVRLEPSAESRLGIVAVPVEMKRVNRERLFGGTVVLPLAVIGKEDKEGEAHPLQFAPDPPASTTEVLKLAEMQALADGAIGQAKVQMNAGRIALKRAETLLQTETGSQRGVDEARTVVELAETALQQAQLRRSLLGTPVREAASLDQVWLKVPVYIGDLAKLDSSQDARMGHLGDRPGRPTRAARFVTGPPSANRECRHRGLVL